MLRREFLQTGVVLAGSLAAGCGSSCNMLKNMLPSETQQEPTPLADVHVHSDCVHSPESIARCAEQFDIPYFKGKTHDEVARIIQPPPGTQDWNTWYKHFAEVRKAYVSPEAIGVLIEDVIKDAAANGVDLLELRVSLLSAVSAMLANQGITDPGRPEYWHAAKQIMDEILAALERTKNALSVGTDLVISISCQKKNEKYVEDLMRFCRDYKNHIAGLDLTNEKDNPPSTYRRYIEDIRGDIRGLTVHCMEMHGPERGWDLIKNFDPPYRIGHGIRAVEDHKLIEELVRRKIPLEMCVLSNKVTGVTPDLSKHPMKRLHEAGLTLLIGSDGCNDGTGLVDNYRVIQSTFGFTDAQMNEFRQNGWNHAFRNR